MHSTVLEPTHFLGIDAVFTETALLREPHDDA